jgi:hypothetical protein
VNSMHAPMLGGLLMRTVKARQVVRPPSLEWPPAAAAASFASSGVFGGLNNRKALHLSYCGAVADKGRARRIIKVCMWR